MIANSRHSGNSKLVKKMAHAFLDLLQLIPEMGLFLDLAACHSNNMHF
jgi:hypothetical protein